MGSDHALIIALLVILVVIVAFQSGSWVGRLRNGGGGYGGNYSSSCGGGGAGDGSGAGCEGFSNPWTAIGKEFAVANAHASSDMPKILREHRDLIPQMARRSASATPEQIARAERSSWFKARENASHASVAFDPEKMTEISDQIDQEHTPSQSGDWNGAIVDLVADKRMRENQSKWNAEMEPFNTTWLKVDDINEASAFGLGGPGHAQGLYTFSRSGPIVRNPIFMTDVGPTEFSQMKSTFRFNG